MKIKVICISDSDKHFSHAISEYEKRLGKDIEIITIKPEKNGTREQIIQKETEKIVAFLEKSKATGQNNPRHILLIKEGRTINTPEIGDIINRFSPVIFIIGGPYGLLPALLHPYIDESVSFGSITLPHGLAKLVLLEQIYRTHMIQHGREYHY